MSDTITLSTVDIITAIAAVAAAIAALYNVFVTWKASEKNALLDNYTAERLNDLHKMKRFSSILLSEASFAVNGIKACKDSKTRQKRIITVANEYACILKPIYKRDRESLTALLALKKELVKYYSRRKPRNIKAIEKAGKNFRKISFLYMQSSWTCIKKQILKGKRPEYKQFNKVYTAIEKKIAEEPDALKGFFEYL